MERLIHTGDTPNGVEFRVYRGRRKTHFYARFFVEGFEFDSLASVGSTVGDAMVNAYERARSYTTEQLRNAIRDELEHRRDLRDQKVKEVADAEAAVTEILAIFDRVKVSAS